MPTNKSTFTVLRFSTKYDLKKLYWLKQNPKIYHYVFSISMDQNNWKDWFPFNNLYDQSAEHTNGHFVVLKPLFFKCVYFRTKVLFLGDLKKICRLAVLTSLVNLPFNGKPPELKNKTWTNNYAYIVIYHFKKYNLPL